MPSKLEIEKINTLCEEEYFTSLSIWEREFVETIGRVHMDRQLSPKQGDLLDKLYTQHVLNGDEQ
jgi:hypothetical protein